MSKADLILIDGNNLLYRSHFAFNTLSAYDPVIGKKTPTGATFGFVTDMIRLINKYKADIIVCWDSGYSYRIEENPVYKSARVSAVESEDKKIAAEQRAAIQHILSISGRKQCLSHGYEADDVIASLVRATPKGTRVAIYSGDNDLNQLISDDVFIIRSKMAEYGLKEFSAEFNLPSALAYYDMQCLTGCKIDDVPGVFGVGVKIAAKILHEAFLKNGIYSWKSAVAYCSFLKKHDRKPDTFSIKIRDKVVDSVPIIVAASKLVSLRDCFDHINWIPPSRDLSEVYNLFEIFQFKSLYGKESILAVEYM